MRKPAASEQCAALSDQGRRCWHQAVIADYYHGESEIYGYLSDWAEAGGPTWVRVALCAKHGAGIEKRRRSKRTAARRATSVIAEAK